MLSLRLYLGIFNIALLILASLFFISHEALASHPDARITSFSSSKTKTVSGEAITISWKSFGITGMNLQIDCSDKIQAMSSSYTASPLPCSKMIFSSPLPANSSLSVSFTNQSIDDQPFRFILFPTFGDGIYDGLHSVPLSITVSTDTIPDPDVKVFMASTTQAISGDSINFSWIIDNAKGANMKISCNPDVTVATSTDALALPCGVFVFSPDLAAKDTKPFVFNNKANTEQAVTLTIAPVLLKGGYDLARSRALTIKVGQKLVSPAPLPVPALLPAPTPAPQSPPVTPPAKSPPATPSKSLTPPATPKTPTTAPGALQEGTPAPLFPPLPPKAKKTSAPEASSEIKSFAPKVFTFFGRIIDFIKYIFWFTPESAN